MMGMRMMLSSKNWGLMAPTISRITPIDTGKIPNITVFSWADSVACRNELISMRFR